MMKMFSRTLVLLLAAGSTGCTDTASDPEATSMSDSPTPSPTQARTSTPPAKPKPIVTFSSSCENEWPQVFAIGDGSDMTNTGYQFLADATVWNDGNAGARVEVIVRWFYVGSGGVAMSKIVEIRAGRQKDVGFTKSASLAQIERMAGHQHGDKMCDAKALLLKVLK